MKKENEKIQFHYQYTRFYFPHRLKLKHFISTQIKKEGRSIDDINFIFCKDDDLLKLNQQYLKHDTLTDIITFEFNKKGQPLLSDIYISIDRVKENASIFHSTFTKELHRVIFHGVLHLVGYKDKTVKEIEAMRKREEEWLNQFFVPRNTVSL